MKKSLFIFLSLFTAGSWCSQAHGNALIKLSAFMDVISGSVRGTVFASNKGGNYVRGKGNPTNPNTPAQSAVRAIFANISQGWRDLLDSTREAWNAAVTNFPYTNRVGEIKELTGKALYQKLNGNLLNIGGSLLTGPPLPADVISVKEPSTANNFVFNATGIGTGIEFGLELVANADDTTYVLEMTPPLSTGVSNPANQFRKVADSGNAGLGAQATITETDFATDASALRTAYENVFGFATVGAKVFMRVKGINAVTGQDAPYFDQATIVV